MSDRNVKGDPMVTPHPMVTRQGAGAGDDLAALGERVQRLPTYRPPGDHPAGDRIGAAAIAEGLAALDDPPGRSK